MDYVNLGPTGLKVSRLCLGVMSYGDASLGWNRWILSPEEGLPFVRQAADAGINFFDTADVYAGGSSEEFLGRAMKEFYRRDQIVIATKVGGRVGDTSPMYSGGWPTDKGLSRKHILDGIDASLKRLGTDYIDLYQIHADDLSTPVEEIAEALHDVVKAGKARYIGASNIAGWRLAQALYKADAKGLHRFISVQHHYNLVYREDEPELIQLMRSEGLASLPWSPIARGFLAGNRAAGTERAQSDPTSGLYGTPSDHAIAEKVQEVAAARGAKAAQVALAWLRQRPGTTVPVIGATKPHHISDAVASLDLTLEHAELQAFDDLYEPKKRNRFG